MKTKQRTLQNTLHGFITVSQAARIIGRDSQTVRYYEKIGRLRCDRIGMGMRIFRLQDVKQLRDELLNSRR